jgi:hypothetical protein
MKTFEARENKAKKTGEREKEIKRDTLHACEAQEQEEEEEEVKNV